MKSPESQNLSLHQAGFQHTHQHIIMLQFPNNSTQTVGSERPDGVLAADSQLLRDSFSLSLTAGLQTTARAV